MAEPMREVSLAQGTVRYRESGSGPPLVFVHGFLVNGTLWRKVVSRLDGQYRCIVPDLPLGAHRVPMRPDADLSPPGLARVIADFIAAVDLEDVTLVANDTGGALAQIMVTEHPDRIARLVLTPCDAFENFLPPAFRPLQAIARVPGALTAALQPLRVRAVRRLPLAFGWLARTPIPSEVTDGWVEPFLTDRGVRRDAVKVLKGVSPRYTLTAAARLSAFDRPTMIAWAPEDRFFPFAHAERLVRIIPDARLERIDDSYTYVCEDQPERTAELVAGFAREPLRRRAAA